MIHNLSGDEPGLLSGWPEWLKVQALEEFLERKVTSEDLEALREVGLNYSLDFIHGTARYSRVQQYKIRMVVDLSIHLLKTYPTEDRIMTLLGCNKRTAKDILDEATTQHSEFRQLAYLTLLNTLKAEKTKQAMEGKGDKPHTPLVQKNLSHILLKEVKAVAYHKDKSSDQVRKLGVDSTGEYIEYGITSSVINALIDRLEKMQPYR